MGDAIAWSTLANRDQNGRAVGGKIYLSKRSLFFEPHLVDRLTAGRSWSCNLDEISGVSTVGRDMNPFSGGLRDRLLITLRGGASEKFVVRHLDNVVEFLAERLPTT